METKEITISLSKKYSINYNVVGFAVSKTIGLDPNENEEKIRTDVFNELDDFSDVKIQHMVDEI